MDRSSDWRAAWARQIGADASPWGMPPRVPVEEIADIRFDAVGRLAVIVGYAGVHRLDLETMRSTQILADGRAERTAVVSANGHRAAVFDQYGPCLHVFDLQAGTHETIAGSKPPLRREMKSIGPQGARIASGLAQSQSRLMLATDAGPVELRPPLGAFTQIRDTTRCADGRVMVAATGRHDPRSDEPSRCLFIFDTQGAALGTVHLAVRGRGAAMVFYEGEAVTVEALRKMGVTVNLNASGEAKDAQARFEPRAPDGHDEVVFGRSGAGFLGRLDLDAPLGERAYEHEDVVRVRRALLGEPSVDDATQRCAEDAAERLRFWAARFESAKTVTIAHDASAGLTPLLPEVAHRLSAKSGRASSNKATRRAVRAVCGDLLRMPVDERRALFEAMCDRLDAENSAVELATLSGLDAGALYIAAQGSQAQLQRFIDAFESHEVGLQGCAPALIEQVLPRLTRLVRVHCGADLGGASALRVLRACVWPRLSVLDASTAWVGDDMAFALALSQGFPRLKTVRLPASASLLARAVLHFSPRLPASIPGKRGSLASLIADGRLAATLRVELLQAASPQTDAPSLRVVAETLPGLALPVLLDLLATLDEPLVLEGFEVASAAVGKFPQSCVLRRCALDFRTAVDLATRAQHDLPMPALIDCQVAPGGGVALFALADIGDHPSAAAIAAFVGNAAPTDKEWLAVVDQGFECAPRAFTAGFEALGEAGAAALIYDRPVAVDWGIRRYEQTLCRATIQRLLSVAAGHPVGPLTLDQTRNDWTLSIEAPRWFTCESESSIAMLTRLVTGQDVLTGDVAFDEIALIRGNAAVALERLDARRRATWTQALQSGVRLTPNGLTGPRPAPSIEILADLLVTAFDGPLKVMRWVRLCARFESEPVGGVRAQLLKAIFESDVPFDKRRSTREHAFVDPDVAVRAVAADDIWPDVDAATDLTTFDGPALAAVLDRLPGERQRAAIVHIGAVGDEACVGALVKAGSGLFKGREIRDAAHAAIAEITTRVGGLRTGGLSVAEAGHGGLSTSDAQPEDA